MMGNRKLVLSVLIGSVKVAILAGVVYLVCMATLKAAEASLPSTKELCDRVRPGMTIEQIDAATRTFEGWQVLRDDGVMVVSSLPYSDKSPVCRVTIDPSTHRASSTSIGPIQRGDWPTL
jgi:hypothetical protein